MFHKPFRVKSNSAVKGSDRRKTRSLLEAQMNITSETSLTIIPNKEEMTVAKIVTHSGNVVHVHIVNKNPVLIEDDGILFPTVPLLWRFPDLLPRIRTWDVVVHKLSGGADLMLPGVVLKGPATCESLHNLRKGQPVAIHVAGNVAPVAVAYATMAATEMLTQGMRGKGFIVVHTAADELIKFGNCKMRIPQLGDEIMAEANGEPESRADAPEVPSEIVADAPQVIADAPEVIADTDSIDHKTETDAESEVLPSIDGEDERESLTGLLADILFRNDEEEEDDSCRDEPDVNPLPTCAASGSQSIISMDQKLEFYFKIAFKFHVRNSDLPLATQQIYRKMQASCPEEDALDFRKSTFKKPLKFFQELQSQGLLKLKEESKGVWTVVEINKASPLMRQIDFDLLPYLAELEEEEEDEDAFQPPVVKELLAVNATVLSLFRDQGYAKGSGISAPEMKKVVTEYIKRNELCSDDDKAKVTLDPQLAQIVLNKGENNVMSLGWNEVFQRITQKMGHCYNLQYPGQQPVLKKGNLPPVTLNVETRSGNKKVTLVENLETFGVNPKDLGKEIRVQAAASTSVSSLPGQKHGKQLLIQGNQVNLIVSLLMEKYNIDKRHINGMEKGEKKKKR